MSNMVKVVQCHQDMTSVGREIIEGGLVVYPTDTVYGVGSSPLSNRGVDRCFEIKSRDKSKAMPVLFSSLKILEEFVGLDERALMLAQRFWPGKITMVLPVRKPSLPSKLIGPSNSLAVRIPNHECCLKLIASCGGSLIGTSANVSGTPPFIDPEDKELFEFAGKADYFVKGPCGKDSLPSTVLDLLGAQVKVVREGAIPSSDILSIWEKPTTQTFLPTET